MNILITGGAGFIGTHLTRKLLSHGHEITILDNFLFQVHGGSETLASDIASHVQLVKGDVADREVLRHALSGANCVVHLAAETGTGQSMYEVCRYERTNLGGSATLYDLLAKTKSHRVERIVVASSRAIYGEGAYSCDIHGLVYPFARSLEEKQCGYFDPLCPVCASPCSSIPTTESAPLQPSSFYGLTKQVQESTALLFGNALKIPTVALRYQNVYGPGQSLANPYTGILAIFSNLARTGKTIQIFEDGKESRDFVHVEDVVKATTASIETNASGCHSINVGSTEQTSVLEVANAVNSCFGSKSRITITGAFREGDIRHGIADLSLAAKLLGYAPEWTFDSGLRTFLNWALDFSPSISGYDESLTELEENGLFQKPA
jgi:dTDP-L-rhamnose 4-epimerase